MIHYDIVCNKVIIRACIMDSEMPYGKRYFKNKASVALNPLVSLIGRLVARSGRKRGNRQTDRQTD